MKPTLLVLAAGMGSRYGGLKQVDPLGPNGETIIDYSIYDAIEAGFGKIVFVIKKSIEHDFKKIMLPKYEGKIPVEYVFQELDKLPEGISLNPERIKPYGTGHAILMGKEVIHEPFAVINGDDFYGRAAFKTMYEFLKHQTPDSFNYAMIGYQLGHTLSENGSVSRGVCVTNEHHQLVKVTEMTKIQRENEKIRNYFEDGSNMILSESDPVSMNFWGFTPSIFNYAENLFKYFMMQNHHNNKAEFYIPLIVTEMIKSQQATIEVLRSDAQWFGITYREDRQDVIKKLEFLYKEGLYPSPLW